MLYAQKGATDAEIEHDEQGHLKLENRDLEENIPSGSRVTVHPDPDPDRASTPKDVRRGMAPEWTRAAGAREAG